MATATKTTRCPHCGEPVTQTTKYKPGTVRPDGTQPTIFHLKSCRPAREKTADGRYKVEVEMPGINHGGYV